MALAQRCSLIKLGFVLAGIPMYYITQRGALMALQRRFRELRVQVCFHEGTHFLPFFYSIFISFIAPLRPINEDARFWMAGCLY